MPSGATNIEELIHDHSAVMADQMVKIAAWANTEEDVRHECNKLIDTFVEKAGLRFKGRHEHHIGSGRLDSKYQGVLLEYKYSKGPGRIDETKIDHPGNKKVVEQLKQRFVDFEREHSDRTERLFGVGCDGDTFIFVRYSGGNWGIEKPQPVTPYSVERLLRALVSLGAQGYSFTPDHLAEHFGSDSEIARKGIRHLYEVITETDNKKAQTFFNQWKILFGEVCGYDVEGRNEKIRKLADHYGIPKSTRPAELLFAVHTYYAIFMKFLAAEIAASFSPLGISTLKRCVGAPTPPKLRHEMENLEQGGIWTQLGISNFLEGDLFSWYLSAWDQRVADVVWKIVHTLDEYDPTTLSVEPAESRDLLKKLYQHLFPKSVRHDLGEYYTPDWLAEHVLNELGYEGDPDKRLLDPACGSGTFLVMTINRIKGWFEKHRHECGFGEADLVQKILKNVIGFDLNPLAVMATRTNYLLAIRDLLRFASGVELPVYLCDSIMTPANVGSQTAQTSFLTESGAQYDPGNPPMALKTAAGTFLVPLRIAGRRDYIAKYSDTLELAVRDGYDADEFLSRCRAEGLPVDEKELHHALYQRIRELDSENQNGIWARIIKNAFAPLFIDRVDYLAGNPPWVNWESLPPDYRESTLPIWDKYHLRPEKGQLGRMRGGKKDLSMLFVYGGVDNYLKEQGRLGFVITQTVFKTRGAGDGFRQLGYRTNGKAIVVKPLVVHDLSGIQVFEGATNRTAVLICEKSVQGFEYPVQYVVWRGPSRVAQDASLDEVWTMTERSELGAMPVDQEIITSPWLTAPPRALAGIRKVVGPSDYQAHEGVNTGGLNGCYWIRILRSQRGGELLVENLSDVGKIKLKRVEATIEPDLVYPLLRGRDVVRWRATPSCFIVAPQDRQKQREGIPESVMREKYPKTYSFLRQFKVELTARADRKYYPDGSPFYTMRNMAGYTRAPWKVVWPEVGHTVRAAVLGPSRVETIKPTLPDHTVVAVSCDSSDEAHYLCAVLNSSPVQNLLRGYVVLHPSPHVLDRIRVPKYQARSSLHRRLCDLSRQIHDAVADNHEKRTRTLTREIDTTAAALWDVTKSEMGAIHEHEIQVVRPPGEECENRTRRSPAPSMTATPYRKPRPAKIPRAAEGREVYITDFDRDQLIDALLKAMGKKKWTRDDAVRAAARRLGFKRTGSKIKDAFKSAINGAIRRGLIEYDRGEIWKAK